MAEFQHFRSAFNGFNRKDVVNYIAYLNNQHSTQLAQLNSQLQTAQEKAEGVKTAAELQAQLDAARAKCAALEQQLSGAADGRISNPAQELEAYRRAERAERQAKERAQQIYDQANGVLSDITLQTEAAANQIEAAADQIAMQLKKAREDFQQAVSSLYAIRPEDE